MIDELLKANQNLEKRVYTLEKAVIKLREMVASSAVKPKPFENARKQNRK